MAVFVASPTRHSPILVERLHRAQVPGHTGRLVIKVGFLDASWADHMFEGGVRHVSVRSTVNGTAVHELLQEGKRGSQLLNGVFHEQLLLLHLHSQSVVEDGSLVQDLGAAHA